MIRCPNTKRRRSGFLLQETLMAMTIVAAVIAGAAQLLHLVAAQRRTAEYRAIAALETANVLEDLLGRRGTELNSTPQVELSPICRQRLPDPQMRIDIVREGNEANSQRISVEVDWHTSGGGRSRPVRLAVWRFQPGEVNP